MPGCLQRKVSNFCLQSKCPTCTRLCKRLCCAALPAVTALCPRRKFFQVLSKRACQTVCHAYGAAGAQLAAPHADGGRGWGAQLRLAGCGGDPAAERAVSDCYEGAARVAALHMRLLSLRVEVWCHLAPLLGRKRSSYVGSRLLVCPSNERASVGRPSRAAPSLSTRALAVCQQRPCEYARCSRAALPSTRATRAPRARRGCTRRWARAPRRTAWAAPGRARATRTPPTACSWTATSWPCATLTLTVADRHVPPATQGLSALVS